jgi:anaerobic magnesium-protoporphyrin IX monomethyl ester cyclase
MKQLRVFLANIGFRQALHPLITPPLGIMYLAAYLRSRFDAELCLVNQREKNTPNGQLVAQIVDFEADIVGLSVMTPNAYLLPEITRQISRAKPDTLVLLGGPHISAFRGESLNGNEADVAIPGEGELAVERVIAAHIDGGRLDDVPGISWRQEDAQVITNPGMLPYIEDLDSLPFPAYDLIDLKPYWRIQSMPPIPRRQYVSLFSSRGCPYRCNYCHRIFGDGFRKHSAERIVDEIEEYQKQFGVRDIEFLDDIFNLDHKRLSEFLELLHKRDLKIEIAFPNGVRTDILREEEIEGLVDAGLYFCSFALESGSPRIQKMMGKNLNISKYLENVELAASKGVFSNGFVMFGFPSETEEDMQQTVDVACQSRLHTASFFTVTPFPSTEIYRIAAQERPEIIRQIDYEGMEYCLVSVNISDVPDSRLYHYQRKANRRFFMNPNRLFRILRDFPKPHLLPLYLPEYVKRAGKGVFDNARSGT